MSLALILASATIRGGCLVLDDPRRFRESIASLREGWVVEVEIRRLRATRSVVANRYYWGVVLHALSEYTGYSPEDLHDICKAKFLPKHLALCRGTGEVVEGFVLGGSTKDLDTAEFTAYIERIRQWAHESLACLIPESDEKGYGHGV